MYERLTQRTEKGTAVFNNVDIGDIAKKLCELEDKICEGKMVELPCAVGEYVYRIIGENTPKPWIWHWEIVEIMIYPDEIVYRDDSDNIIENKDFGLTVFLTPEEANKKLKELENEQR